MIPDRKIQDNGISIVDQTIALRIDDKPYQGAGRQLEVFYISNTVFIGHPHRQVIDVSFIHQFCLKPTIIREG